MKDVSRRDFLAMAATASLVTLPACMRGTPAAGAIQAAAPKLRQPITRQQAAEEPEPEQVDTTDAPAQEAPAATPEQDASGFVLLADVAPDIIQEIRYYTTFNFVGERIDGYEQPVALVTREAGEALARASQLAMERGYRLKVFDAYRPQQAVVHFIRWGQDLNDTRMKQYFYPELDKSVLFYQGYIAERSGHTRGSTLDLTLFDMNAGREADAGGSFDYFGELSHTYYENITEEQYAVRMTLHDVMVEAGFLSYSSEWWHFTLESEPYPDTYFTFPVSVASLR